MAEQWLTYQQASEHLGVTAEAVRHRARRLKWRTQPGNDGRALVLVSDDVEARHRVQPPVRTPVQPPVQTGDANALAEAVTAFREVEAQLRAERDEALARAAQAEREREAARIAAAAAEGEAKGLREALAEARRPFWRRWMG